MRITDLSHAITSTSAQIIHSVLYCINVYIEPEERIFKEILCLLSFKEKKEFYLRVNQN